MAADERRKQYSRGDLAFGIIDRSDHRLFDQVYEVYKKCFGQLPDELESKENFKEYLDGNGQAGKPGKEMWVYAIDKQTGQIVGVNNFAAFSGGRRDRVSGTIHDTYMAVSPDHRNQGVFKLLIEARERAALEYFRSMKSPLVKFLMFLDPRPKKVATFAEQNNPLMMTPDQYVTDAEASIDGNVRRGIYERAGFRTLAMRYVQPDLGEEEGPCKYLDLVARVSRVSKLGWLNRLLRHFSKPERSIPGILVKRHLERFFKQSFPEGTDLGAPGLEGMARDLRQFGQVRFLQAGSFEKLALQVNLWSMQRAQAAGNGERLIGQIEHVALESFYAPGVRIEHVMHSMVRACAFAESKPKTALHSGADRGQSALDRLAGARHGLGRQARGHITEAMESSATRRNSPLRSLAIVGRQPGEHAASRHRGARP